MRAVSRAERVVNIAVGIRSQPLDELLLAGLHCLLRGGFLLVAGVVGQSAGLALLLGVEAQVLEQQHLSGLQRSGLFRGLVAHAVVGEVDFHAQTGFDAGNDVPQRELGLGALFRTSQMRHQNDGAALFEHFLDRRDSGADARVVGNFQLLVQGHVEVDADNRALALEIVRVD